MTVLGLDPQASGLRAALCEGGAPAWPPVTVSEARRAADAPSIGDLLMALGRAAEAGASVDWGRLGRRLAAFTGEPPDALGVRSTVVARLGGGAREPGGGAFGAVQSVCAGRAALVASLAQPGWLAPDVSGAVVLVADETAVGVHGFVLDAGRTGGVRVVRAVAPRVVRHTGAGFWVAEAFEIVRRRAPRLTPEHAGRAFWMSASDLGRRLAEAPNEDAPVEWAGAAADLLMGPTGFSVRECQAWPSVRQLVGELPRALDAVVGLVGPASPILIAGAGAAWPFVRDLAARRTPAAPLILASPEMAVARGAAFWPAVGERVFEGCQGGAA